MNIRHILKLIAATLLVMIVNVLVSVLVVTVYAHLINTGHPNQFYEEFATNSAPYISIIAGFPLMLSLCWWLSRRWPPELVMRSVILIWMFYAVIDITIVMASGEVTSRLALLVTVSMITKLIAAVMGGKLGSRQQAA